MYFKIFVRFLIFSLAVMYFSLNVVEDYVGKIFGKQTIGLYSDDARFHQMNQHILQTKREKRSWLFTVDFSKKTFQCNICETINLSDVFTAFLHKLKISVLGVSGILSALKTSCI